MLTGISLFSGAVDGLAIAFEMAGIHVTHHVEYDAFCCANLRRLHPNATVIEGDIKELKELPYADVIFGGPPCQGFSGAGSRNGFADERYLWPEMFRLVQQCRPQCVLVENVRGATSGDNLVDAVLSDLESIGYTGGAFLVPACLFGAPHERYRVFIVAYTKSAGYNSLGKRGSKTTTREILDNGFDKCNSTVAYTSSFGHPGQSAKSNATPDEKRNPTTHQQSGDAKPNANLSSRSVLGNTASIRRNRNQTFPRSTRQGKEKRRLLKLTRASRQHSYEPGLGGTADGAADGMDRFEFPGFPAGQGTFQYPFEPPRTIAEKGPYHKERIKALGNAVVWQQAYPFAQAIATYLNMEKLPHE